MTEVVLTRRSTGRTLPDAEKGHGLLGSQQPSSTAIAVEETALEEAEALAEETRTFLDRFLRRGKSKVGVVDSLRAIAFSSWLNIFLVFIPIAWFAHFANVNDEPAEKRFSFILCFMAVVPLEKLFDFGGEQMAIYLGEDFGDLAIISLNNVVEATLAIILLKKCLIRLLQSTIIGVVLLHLLLVPGVAFVTGGAKIIEQDLHPHLTQLNHTLLTIGVFTLLLPAAFFAAINTGVLPAAVESAASTASEAVRAVAEAAGQTTEAVTNTFITDTQRTVFLQVSRGLAVILLVIYICSRAFLHNPPGQGNNELALHKLAPEAVKERAKEFSTREPEVNQWVCIAMLVVTIGIMAATAEWLVDSIDFVQEQGGIEQEWFGVILLPLVSFSGDAFISILYFVRSTIQSIRGLPQPPAVLASARGIDLSIQFTLFWMPFIVLLGWWIDRPMLLLFDVYEVALVIASCFIVNYVTADSKTNWVEGFAMLAFYVMIALTTWFYPGQEALKFFVNARCISVEETIAIGIEAAMEAASGE